MSNFGAAIKALGKIKAEDVGQLLDEVLEDDDDSEEEQDVEMQVVMEKETTEQKLLRQQSMREEEEKHAEEVLEKYVKSETCQEKYCNKGSISNFITFIVMIIGFILYYTSKGADLQQPASVASTYILSIGLFGFAGGLTNWLAIKMLFDRIPFLAGSGVIPRQFKSIRSSVKNTIMEAFFDPEYLETYATDRAKDLIARTDIPAMILETLNKPTVHATLVLKLKQLSKQKNASGRFLKMAKSLVPGGIDNMVKTTKPIVAKMAGDIVPTLLNSFDLKEFVEIETLQQEIDSLMTEKLELLTPDMVKELLERVVREHLGWLVVWGNVFGGLIGLITNAIGLGPA